MKRISTFLLICCMGLSLTCSAQTSKEPIKKDSSKQTNLLDEQAKTLGSVFGNLEAEGENPFAGITNYLDLIEKMEGPEEDKQYLRDQYKLYDMSLDPKKKEEFKIMFNKKLKEAIEKAQIEQ